MLISSLSLTFLSTKSFKPFFEKNETFSSGVVRFIVSPGHRQTRTSNNSFILFISTLFEVKNSSLGSHSTLVPCSLLFPISRFEKTPSLKDTFSNFPSLKEVTTNQCAKKFVSLLGYSTISSSPDYILLIIYYNKNTHFEVRINSTPTPPIRG